MMLESFIERAVCRYAEDHGWIQRKMRYIGRNGCPDRFFFKDDRVLVVEFKAPDKKPNPQQGREHKRLREHGMTIHVIDGIEQGCALFGE